ncbi:MAG: hypothetical protein MR606_05910 [Mollicutes bacterium]|nr:hypothetical protein [Mollicutes bacterium]
MKKKLINSQMSNFATYNMYLRQLLTLAENVFEFKNLPTYIDISYLNKQLLRNGSIAFFMDEVLGLLALPYVVVNGLDVYGRPRRIEVLGQNGYRRMLNSDEFVIMYDNNGRYPLYLDICQYAERLALDTRTADINIAQQKTPRVFKTTPEKERSLKDLVNNVDGYENTIITYDNLEIDETTMILAPAPYVTDKIDLHKQNDYAEFLRLIGISNLSFQKKERNISDEIQAMQGGTIASRFSRFEPRKRAVEEINLKFNQNIEVSYYDGEPSTIKEADYNESIFDSDSNSEDSNY